MGSGRSAGRSREDENARRRFWPPPEGAGLALAGLGLIFLAHLAYGALRIEASLIAVGAAALLLLACIAIPSVRRDLLRVRGLAIPAILFGLVLLAGVLSLTPYGPAGVHPVWAYVGQTPGAATIDRSATTLELIKLLGLGCIFLVGAATGASDARAKTAVNLMIALAAIFGLWAFFSFATGTQYQTQRGRLEGTLMSPNTAGTFFAMLVIVTLGPLLRDLRGVRNAAGADFEARIGEWHDPETHAIPLAIAAAMGANAGFKIFGRDYPTRDGTAVRDYIHVLDLADAHVRALKHLLAGGESAAFNLGTGTGCTVQELVDAISAVSGRPFEVTDAPRREGDAPALVADNRKAREVLGWAPQYGLSDILDSAWRWHTQGLPRLRSAAI